MYDFIKDSMALFPIPRLVRSVNCDAPLQTEEEGSFYPEIFPKGHRLVRSTNESYTEFSRSDFRHPLIRCTNEDPEEVIDVQLSFETKAGILCSTIILHKTVFTFPVLKYVFDILKG